MCLQWDYFNLGLPIDKAQSCRDEQEKVADKPDYNCTISDHLKTSMNNRNALLNKLNNLFPDFMQNVLFTKIVIRKILTRFLQKKIWKTMFEQQ